MTPYFEAEGVQLIHGDCLELMPSMAGVDHILADPPYSERTHSGHNCVEGVQGRRGIGYEPWTVDHVQAFVEAARLMCPGWIVAMSDHVLQPAWEAFLAATGRYVFPPLPYVARGSRYRMYGDGPAQWTVQVNVARPPEQRFLGWGSLPGAYVLPKGEMEQGMFVGGKPLWLMRELVRDYSREGETVLDPVCGGGSTLVACLQLGRRAVGIDNSEAACAWAAKRLEKHLKAGIT